MALADIVLEGLTLILVIALGAVLIGGLSYLTTTTASTNNARLITAGTYVYLAGPTYINGTLYVPMYNIGEYTVEVKYLFVEGLNGVQEYATNIILKPGQYYVYELSIDYTPKAVTIVVSPMRDPKLALEFNSNVSTPGPIALTPIGQGGSGNCPILASVTNDSVGAGWEVEWTMAGGSYSVSESTSYQWCILPPYYPITIDFQSSITNNPSNYQCSISPQTAQVDYNGTPTTQEFTVNCQQLQSSGNNYAYVYTDVETVPNGVSWTVDMYYDGILAATYQGVGNQTLENSFNAGGTVSYQVFPGLSNCNITYSPSQSIDITPGYIYNVTITITCQPPPYFVYVNVTDYYAVTGFGPIGAGWTIYSSVSYISGSGNVIDELLQIGGYTDTLYAQVQPPMNGYTCTINPSTVSVVNGSSYAFTVNCEQSSGGNSGSNYFVYVTVINDTLNAGWQVSSSVSSISGSGDVDSEQLQIGGPTDTLTASVTSPSGYACSISPGSTQATNGSTYTFTVSCVQSPYPPCPVTAPSVSSSPSGAPTPSSSASVSSIPYNQTETVTFTYNAPLSGNNYVFQYWSIGGQTYQNNVVNITETLTCTTPGGTLTGPSGTAYYQYQPPGGVKIDPDTIDLNQTSETYTFTWTSAWSGTGTLTWNISGLVFIYYNSTPAGLVVWSANVTLPNGIIAAQGSGFLKITNYPQPSNPLSFYVCVVGGYGTVNDVDVNQGSAKGTVYIACELY
jgi:hypothetical protein